MLATVSDTVDAEGVLLFNESYVAGGGTLGYLAADGERVSAGTAVAEVYSDASQAALRQQLTQLGDQIDLLQKSQNASATQLDTMRKERSSALYDLMDALDSGEYDETEKGTEEYLLAQNKLWVITGEVTDFSGQIAALVDQSLCAGAAGYANADHSPADRVFLSAARAGPPQRRGRRHSGPGRHRPESLYRVRAGNGTGWLCGQDRLGLFLAV